MFLKTLFVFVFWNNLPCNTAVSACVFISLRKKSEGKRKRRSGRYIENSAEALPKDVQYDVEDHACFLLQWFWEEYKILYNILDYDTAPWNEPFLALLLFSKVCICPDLLPEVIKALPSKQNTNFQWCWSLENTNDSIKNVCLWKWAKPREKPFMRIWEFMFLTLSYFWLFSYNLLTIFQWSAHSGAVWFITSCVYSSLVFLFQLPIWET